MDELEQYRLRYVLYIAEMQIDEEKGFPPLFTYGETEQQARVNLQPVFSPADWSRVKITSITPHPEGFDLSEEIHLTGLINELFYREYVSTIQRIELPPKGVIAFARPLTTTLDIFADILQRLVKAGAIVEAIIEVDEEEHIEEDEAGKEVVVEAGTSEIWAMVEKEIQVDKTGLSLLADQDFPVEDVDTAWFGLSYSLWKTNRKTLCALVTEFADAGHFVQANINDEDVRILELEYLDTGKVRAYYLSLEDGMKEKRADTQAYHTVDDLSLYTMFFVRYDEEEAQSRLYAPHFDAEADDAFEIYREVFLPRIRAARENGEIPGLLF
jgi:hypothetical protein